MREYYEITTNTDNMEGKGRCVGTGVCFEQETDAQEFCRSKRYARYAVMGVVNEHTKNNYMKKIVPTPYKNIAEYDLKQSEEYKAKVRNEVANVLKDLNLDQLMELKKQLNK